jgi:hypothetical protein
MLGESCNVIRNYGRWRHLYGIDRTVTISISLLTKLPYSVNGNVNSFRGCMSFQASALRYKAHHISTINSPTLYYWLLYWAYPIIAHSFKMIMV